MYTYQIPKSPSPCIGLCTKMIQGMEELGVELDLTYTSAPQMKTKLDAFVSVNNLYNAARSALTTASGLFQEALVPNYEWIQGVKNMLITPFGTRWNTQWVQVGFITPSVALPSKVGDQVGMNLSMSEFFRTQPSYENATLKLTAAEGVALRTAALEAEANVSKAKALITTLDDTWVKAYDALATVMHALLDNLGRVLADNDPRWLRFGLQMPITNTTPGQVQNVVAQMDENGNLVLTCDTLPLTTRFRWRLMLVGVQESYYLAASTTEPMAIVKGIKLGQTVQIVVQAVNGTLQGKASEPIQFTMLLPMVRSIEAKAVEPSQAVGVAELVAPIDHGSVMHRNGNGNGNRNGNGKNHGELAAR